LEATVVLKYANGLRKASRREDIVISRSGMEFKAIDVSSVV